MGVDLSRRDRTHGFTLLELLLVVVIAGVILGVVSFNAMPGQRQALQQEAQRMALLLQLARDEAILRNRPILFEVNSTRYRFLMREQQQWTVMSGEELLRERQFDRPPVTVAVTPSISGGSEDVRIMFGREPVDKAFTMTLSSGDAIVTMRADGVGHFVVE